MTYFAYLIHPQQCTSKLLFNLTYFTFNTYLFHPQRWSWRFAIPHDCGDLWFFYFDWLYWFIDLCKHTPIKYLFFCFCTLLHYTHVYSNQFLKWFSFCWLGLRLDFKNDLICIFVFLTYIVATDTIWTIQLFIILKQQLDRLHFISCFLMSNQSVGTELRLATQRLLQCWLQFRLCTLL